jgi:hypothetical protein
MGGMQMQQQGQGDVLMGLSANLLADAPMVMGKQHVSSGGAGPMPGIQQQQRQPPQPSQQPPSTPAFSWDSVGEALQGFGEGADDSLAWDDLSEFDLPDLKQHEVDELLNF